MKRLFVCSFVRLLEALAQKIIRPEHLENALFFFPTYPETYFLNVVEMRPGVFFDTGTQDIHLENFQAIVPHLLKAKEDGRILYEGGSTSFFQWLTEMGYIGNAQNFGNILFHMQDMMGRGRVAVVGGGVTLSALGETLSAW